MLQRPAQKPLFSFCHSRKQTFLEGSPRKSLPETMGRPSPEEFVSSLSCLNLQKPLPPGTDCRGCLMPSFLGQHPGGAPRPASEDSVQPIPAPTGPGDRMQHFHPSLPTRLPSQGPGCPLPWPGRARPATRSCKQPHAPPPGAHGANLRVRAPSRRSPATCAPHGQTH